jgi:hypothetical protein
LFFVVEEVRKRKRKRSENEKEKRKKTQEDGEWIPFAKLMCESNRTS